MRQSKPYLVYGIYVLLSVCIIMFASYARMLPQEIVAFYDRVNDILNPVFSGSSLGTTLRQSVSLVLCPLMIVGIPALIYKTIKHKTMPYLIEAIWIVWIITLLSRILM